MGLSYGTQNFGLAVHTLATGTWPLKARLRDAYISNLLPMQPREDLPNELWSEFFALKNRLSELCRADLASNDNRPRPLDDVFPDLDEQEAKQLAGKIVTIYHELMVRTN